MDYISIKGYKSIYSASLEFAPINILIGANGAGKSNFLSFFDFLNSLYEQRLQEYVALNGGVDKMLFQGRKETEEIGAFISFNDKVNSYSFSLNAGEESFVFTQEGLWYYDDMHDIATYGYESNARYSNERNRINYINAYMLGFKKYHFHETGKKSPFNNVSNIENDSYFLYSQGQNLAAMLYAIREGAPTVYKRILKNIQSIAPYFSDFFLQPNKKDLIRLQWTDKYSDNLYGANDLSDGTIRFIALTILFMQPELPHTLIIDEPELGLHPTAIAKLAGMIQSAAARGTKVIVATQSADLVNHFEPEDIVTVDQVKGKTCFNRLNEKELSEWLVDYSIGDLWQRNIIQGGQPNNTEIE